MKFFKTVIALFLVITTCALTTSCQSGEEKAKEVENTVSYFLTAYIKTDCNVEELKTYIDENSDLYDSISAGVGIPDKKELLSEATQSEEVADMIMERVIAPIEKIISRHAKFTIDSVNVEGDEADAQVTVVLPTVNSNFANDLFRVRLSTESELGKAVWNYYKDEYFGVNADWKYISADEKTKDEFASFVMKNELEHKISSVNLEDYVVDKTCTAQIHLKRIKGEWKISKADL